MRIAELWLFATLLLACPVLGREPARVTLYCTSLRFEEATGGPGLAATLQLSTDAAFSEINGELRPLYDASLPTHGSGFRLEDPTFPENIIGRIGFDTPAHVDANGNGFDDFFEVRQEVIPTGAAGFFETPVDRGLVTATWSRAAGSVTGTCRLELTGDIFGELPTFTATFALLEYTGNFQYTPATNAISGMLAVTQTQSPANAIGGNITLTRVETNRFDQLRYASGTLTNAAGLPLRYVPGLLDRDPVVDTNYYGFLDFEDGDPSTGTQDYIDWVLSIDDLNDADGDGIPDLSDDPTNGSGPGPELTLARAGTELILTMGGAAGRSYDLEETVALGPFTWTRVQTIALTNASQALFLPAPPTSTRFWRARVRE